MADLIKPIEEKPIEPEPTKETAVRLREKPAGVNNG